MEAGQSPIDRWSIRENTDPVKIALDKRGSNKTSVDEFNRKRDVSIEVRPIRHLNHITEQDRRAIKTNHQFMLGFISLCAPSNLLAGNKAHIKSGFAQSMQQNFISIH